MGLKWKLKKRTYIYKAKTPDEISFVRDKLILPSGKEINYVHVDCPYEVVYVIGLNANLQVSLIKQYRYIVDKYILEVPAGSPNLGETLEEGAAREFEEETGYHPNKLVKLASFYPAVGVMNQFSHVYLALNLKKTTQQLEETEIIKLQWTPIKEAMKLVKHGEIISLGSAYGLLLVESWVKKHIKKKRK